VFGQTSRSGGVSEHFGDGVVVEAVEACERMR
jgi:hypothetical protein